MRRALVLAALAAASCSRSSLYADVDGATIPECDQTVPAEAGPTIAFWGDSHEELYALPKGPVVRIAADREVSWRRVKAMEARLRAQGSRPVLLCSIGETDHVAAFEPTETLQPGKHLSFYASPNGEFFVGEPDGDLGTHVAAFDKTHIAKSFIRDAMGPMVAKYGVHDVEVHADPHMNWADMVRAVDGARTCCDGVAMRASLAE